MLESDLSRLLLADRLTACRVAQSRTVRILAVGEHDPAAWRGGGDRVWIPLTDGEQIVPQDFVRAIAALDDLWKQGGQIVVCCHAGESRSAAVVVGWMVMKHRPLVDSLPPLASVFDLLHPVFQEAHWWALDGREAERREIPEQLLREPSVPSLLACYAFLGNRFPRVYLNVGLWSSLVRSGVFKNAIL